MSKPPYFPFFPDDFCTDGKVEAMTTTGVGAYILLLCKAWRENPPATVPDSDPTLARWARLSLDSWLGVREEVLGAWVRVDGRWMQKRLRKEWDRFQERSKLAAESAKSGWPRKRRANAKRSHSERNARVISESGSESDSPFPPDLDTEVFRSAWLSWTAYRREAKLKVYTPSGMRAQLKRLAKEFGHDGAIAAIEHSIANGYQGIYADKSRAGGEVHRSQARGSAEARRADERGRVCGGTGWLDDLPITTVSKNADA